MAACLLMIGVSGCSSGPLTEFCEVAQPIHPSRKDACMISQSFVDQVVLHNETGKKLCGWEETGKQQECR